MAGSHPYKYIGADSVASSSDVTANDAPRSHRRPRRRHPRFSVDLPVEIARHESRARCTSLSIDGMFVSTRERIAVGKRLLMRLYLPGRLRLVIPAVVCWTTHDGAGLRFTALGETETSSLTDYLDALRTARR